MTLSTIMVSYMGPTCLLKRISLAAVLMVSFLGSAADAADYFPLQIGNRWTYSPSYGDKGDRVDTIVGTESVNGTFTYIWNRQEAPDDNYNEKRWYAKDDSYVKFYKIWGNEGLDPPFSPISPWRVFKLNPIVGDTWISEADFGTFDFKTTYYVESTTDDVTVPAGTFSNCIRVRELNEMTVGNQTEYEYEKHWYAPSVGPVIYRDYNANWSSVNFSQELVTYSIIAGRQPMPWIPLLLLGGEDTLSMVTPYVDISDMASINEAFSSNDSAPWGFVHYGIDFFPNGNLKSFRAVSAGVVERIDKFLNEGNSNWQINVELRLNATYSVGYAFEPMSSDEADGDTQLANIFVIAGQKVKQGDIIGNLYAVGEGTHVDFGFYKNGVAICPEPYFAPEARDSILTLLHEVYPIANICY